MIYCGSITKHCHGESGISCGEQFYDAIYQCHNCREKQFKLKLDVILNHADGIERCIGHIRSGANVTQNELWSACESLDQLFTAINDAKEFLE